MAPSFCSTTMYSNEHLTFESLKDEQLYGEYGKVTIQLLYNISSPWFKCLLIGQSAAPYYYCNSQYNLIEAIEW